MCTDMFSWFYAAASLRLFPDCFGSIFYCFGLQGFWYIVPESKGLGSLAQLAGSSRNCWCCRCPSGSLSLSTLPPPSPCLSPTLPGPRTLKLCMCVYVLSMEGVYVWVCEYVCVLLVLLLPLPALGLRRKGGWRQGTITSGKPAGNGDLPSPKHPEKNVGKADCHHISDTSLSCVSTSLHVNLDGGLCLNISVSILSLVSLQHW